MSELDKEFERRGLMRRGQVAYALGVDSEVVHRISKSGAIPVEWFEWHGAKMWGIPVEAVDKLRAAVGRT